MRFSVVLLGLLLVASRPFITSADDTPSTPVPAVTGSDTSSPVVPATEAETTSPSEAHQTSAAPGGPDNSTTEAPDSTQGNSNNSTSSTSTTVKPSTTPSNVSTTTKAPDVTSSTPANTTTATSQPPATTLPATNTTANEPNNTSATNETTEAPPAGSSTSEPSSSSNTSATSNSPTAAPTASAPTEAPTLRIPDVNISETNLFLSDSDVFIELKGPADTSLEGLTLAVFTFAASVKDNYTFTKDNKTDSNGFFIYQLDKDRVKDMQTAVVALYNTSSIEPRTVGPRDFIFASSSFSASRDNVDGSLREMLKLNNDPVIVVNKTKLEEMNVKGATLTRCEQFSSRVVVSTSTKNALNDCSFVDGHPLQLKAHTDSSDSFCNQKSEKEIEKFLVDGINERCQCGMTRLLIAGGWQCKPGMYLNATLRGVFQSQSNALYEAYLGFMGTHQNITVDQNVIYLTKCANAKSCFNHPAVHPSDDGDNSATVTVAVVLSCIAVFLVIFVAVVIYMRRKRRGILQFRMTRLAEDDDMEDMDDFIGGGGMVDHEPSFSNSQYNLTS